MAAREPQGEGDTVAANGVGCYSFSLHHHEHTDSCVATVGLTDGRERIQRPAPTGTRNSAMTAAWTVTVAPRSGSWEGSAADVAGPPRRADRPARLRAVRDSHTALIHQVKPLATRRLHARPRA
jgi:hypothetical protein